MKSVNLITPFGGKIPAIHPKAFVDISARIIGDVSVGSGASIWPGAVIRADSEFIRIGERAVVLDLALMEAPEGHPAILEDEALVSHNAVIHGAYICSRALIGIGAIILDGAVISSGSIIAAGSLVPPGTEIPPNSLVMGVPGKRVRAITEDERRSIMTQLQEVFKKSRGYMTAGNSE
jgi:carbonic anhydrase/acetyltransferase-like protein (isoleucine patch superfamily)